MYIKPKPNYLYLTTTVLEIGRYSNVEVRDEVGYYCLPLCMCRIYGDVISKERNRGQMFIISQSLVHPLLIKAEQWFAAAQILRV